MIKKVLLTVSILTIFFCVLNMNTFATEADEPIAYELEALDQEQSYDDSGVCGDNVTWEYYSASNTLIIKGNGPMQTKWTCPYTAVTTAIIEPGVTTVSERAFYNCSSLQNVTIPSGVTKIGTYAFYSCKKLTKIELPGTVETIERFAFSACSKLQKVIFNEGLVTIGERAFFNCVALKSLELPDSLVTIDRYAFNRCKAITSVIIPGNVKKIGLYAFYECVELESVFISKSVQTIGESVFKECSNLKTVSIDEENPYFCVVDNVLYDKDQTLLIAYPMAKADNEFTVPDTVVAIANSAFYGCSNLDKITFSDTTKTIGEWSFAYCTSLESLYFPSGMKSIGTWAFAYCSGIKHIDISDTVTTIGSGAFGHCKAIQTVYIPASITTIEVYAFTDCTSLDKITVDEENPYFCAVDNVLYNKDRTELLRYAPAKSDTVFTVPDTVKTVSTDSFSYSTKLKKVVINEGVTQLLNDAFLSCTALSDIVLPKTMSSVGGYVFYECNALKTVYYDGDANSWKTITIKDGNTKLTGAKILYAHIVTFTGDLNDVQKVYTGEYANFPVAEYGYKYIFTVDGAQWEERAITKDVNVDVELVEVDVIRSSVYTIRNGLIRKIEPGTTVGTFLANVTSQGRIKVFKNETATKSLGDTVKIGTGCIAKLYDADDNVICTLQVVIKGDVSGNGSIATVDMTLLKGNIGGSRVLTDVQIEAVNLVDPNTASITTRDLIYLKGVINGTRVIQQA